jgi:hypothetical protein
LAEARAGKRTLYFVDASHFVLASFLGWVWCFVRLHVRAASGRQRYNVLGALNAVTHELVTEINETYINALSVCALLRKIACRGGSDHVGVGQCPVSALRLGAELGEGVGDRFVVFAVVFSEPESDRTIVEVGIISFKRGPI